MWYLVILVAIVHCGISQDADDCRCVSFHLCREESGTIITDGAGLVDERIGPFCSSCNCTVPEVCCSLSNNKTVPDLKPKGVSKGCGYRNPDGVGFKVGTESGDALFGEFPWMVAIFENGKYRCGGSLIHPSAVLTAAHCVKLDRSVYTVRAGEWDSGSTVETLKHQDRTVESIKIHESFNPNNYHNDIALVFVNEPFKLGAHIDLACLVPLNKVTTDGTCYATGWGKDRFGVQGRLLPILRKVELPIVERNKCQENLRETRLGRYFNLHESFVCAGGEKNKDTCTGDGGGPLVCPIENTEERYQQVGITAWGIGCNDEKIPGVYTNVAALRSWIDKQMNDKQLGVQGYQNDLSDKK